MTYSTLSDSYQSTFDIDKIDPLIRGEQIDPPGVGLSLPAPESPVDPVIPAQGTADVAQEQEQAHGVADADEPHAIPLLDKPVNVLPKFYALCMVKQGIDPKRFKINVNVPADGATVTAKSQNTSELPDKDDVAVDGGAENGDNISHMPEAEGTVVDPSLLSPVESTSTGAWQAFVNTPADSVPPEDFCMSGALDSSMIDKPQALHTEKSDLFPSFKASQTQQTKFQKPNIPSIPSTSTVNKNRPTKASKIEQPITMVSIDKDLIRKSINHNIDEIILTLARIRVLYTHATKFPDSHNMRAVLDSFKTYRSDMMVLRDDLERACPLPSPQVGPTKIV